MGTQNTPTNSDLAREWARLADVLAEYDHLPPLRWGGLNLTGLLRFHPYLSGEDGIATVAAWAAAFGAPVVFDQSNRDIGTVYVEAYFAFGERDARIQVTVRPSRADWLLGAADVSPSFKGNPKVYPERLLEALAPDSEQQTLQEFQDGQSAKRRDRAGAVA